VQDSEVPRERSTVMKSVLGKTPTPGGDITGIGGVGQSPV